MGNKNLGWLLLWPCLGCQSGVVSQDVGIDALNDQMLLDVSADVVGDRVSVDVQLSDGPSDAGDSGVTCTPIPGTNEPDFVTCDHIQVALMRNDEVTTANVYGRVGSPEWGCTHVDEVQILSGQNEIQTAVGVGSIMPGNPIARLASAPAVPALAQRCESDAMRFDSLITVIRGRYDGGTFEVRCGGSAEWPPQLLTCHENVSDRPLEGFASVTAFAGSSTTGIDAYVPFPQGTILSINPSLRIIPVAFPTAPPVPGPFTVSGWTHHLTGTASAPGMTFVQLSSSTDALGTAVCPPPSNEPFSSPPRFLARIEGRTAAGDFSTEVFVQSCTRSQL